MIRDYLDDPEKFGELLDRATIRFREHYRRKVTQDISPRDCLAYWVVYELYLERDI